MIFPNPENNLTIFSWIWSGIYFSVIRPILQGQERKFGESDSKDLNGLREGLWFPAVNDFFPAYPTRTQRPSEPDTSAAETYQNHRSLFNVTSNYGERTWGPYIGHCRTCDLCVYVIQVSDNKADPLSTSVGTTLFAWVPVFPVLLPCLLL